MNSNLARRIGVAVVAIPAILWICYQGGMWLVGMVALFSVLAMIEFVKAEGYKPGDIWFWPGPLALLAMLGNVYAILDSPTMVLDFRTTYLSELPAVGALIFFLTFGMLVAIGKRAPSDLFARYTRYLWGVVYIAGLYPFVILLGSLRGTESAGFQSGDVLLFLFGVLWVGDTAAMGFGRWIGRHKLAPAVSPNKTVEGFVGGLLGAAVIGGVMIFWRLSNLPWQHVIVMALGCSVFGQLGDLVESMWKRSLGIKDSSAIIPGHGGLLDRFDSLLFAAPFLYFYFRAVILP